MQVLYDHRYVGSNDVHPLAAKIVSSLEANAVLSGCVKSCRARPETGVGGAGIKPALSVPPTIIICRIWPFEAQWG